METVASSSGAGSTLWGLGSSNHRHGVDCGHIAIQHGDHVGFLADGQLECLAATNDIHPNWMDNLCFEAHPGTVEPAGAPLDLHGSVNGSVTDRLSSSTCCDEKITHMHAHLHLDEGTTRKLMLSKSVDLCALPGSLDGCVQVPDGGGPGDEGSHSHSHSCGHELIPHGDHYDYLVPPREGYRLDHQHVAVDGRTGHVDDHGRLIRREGVASSGTKGGRGETAAGDISAAAVLQPADGASLVPGVGGKHSDAMAMAGASSSSPPACPARAHGPIFRFLSRGMALTSLPLFPGHAAEAGGALEKASLLGGADPQTGDDEGGSPAAAGGEIQRASNAKAAARDGGGSGSKHSGAKVGDVVIGVAQGAGGAPPGSRPPSATRLVLTVNGICCPSEVPLIERILAALPGVESVTVNVPTRHTVVVHDPEVVAAGKIVDALNDASLDASIHKMGDEGDETSLGHRYPPWDTTLAGALIALSLFSLLYHPLKYVALGAVALRAPRMGAKMLASLRRCLVDVNILMAIAVAGAIAIGDYVEAGTVLFLFALAEWLELRASEKSRRAMSAMLALAPERATLAATGETLPVEDIRVGARLLVKPGDKLPIDGIVVSGSSNVTEANLTGESMPVAKRRGSRVFAGTINQSGAFTMQTTALACDSAIARMVRLVEEAQMRRTKSERVVETFARFYTPAIVLAAALVAIIPVAMGRNYKDWLYLALVLLVVACPCALVISTPVTAVCGLAQAARLGILVKGGTHLETLGRVRAVALDKTGTLTEGHFRVSRLELVAETSVGTATAHGSTHGGQPGNEGAADGDGGGVVDGGDIVRGHGGGGGQDVISGANSVTLPQALYWLAAVESCSSHPLADALVTFAKKHGVETGAASVEEFSVLPGEGVCATVDGQGVFVGNGDLAARLGWRALAGQDTLDKLRGWELAGGTVGWVGFEARPLAVFSLADVPRREAAEAVARLSALGVSVTMLTGDGWGAAHAVARQVGVDDANVFAALHPEHKVMRVQALKAALPKHGRNKLAMVGDGINDAPALAAADLGVAMGVAGTAVAMETGDVALMTNNLTRLADAVQLGRSCRMTVIANIVFSVVCKLAFIGITLAGWTTLWMAVLADVGTSLAVTYNGTRVLKKRPVNAVCVSAGSTGDKVGGACDPAGHGHGHGHGGVFSHLWRRWRSHGHAHGAGSCGLRKGESCQLPLLPTTAPVGGGSQKKSCGPTAAVPVGSTQAAHACCANKACAADLFSTGALAAAPPSPRCCATKSCHPAQPLVTATAKSGCCANSSVGDKACGSGPVLMATAAAPKRGCCASKSCDPAPAVVVAAAPKSGCCASKSCNPAPEVVVAAAPKSGCCASKSCDPAPAVVVAAAPKSGCCASKSCRSGSH